MRYVEFDETRPMDLILLGRVAIDFNPLRSICFIWTTWRLSELLRSMLVVLQQISQLGLQDMD